MEIGKRLIEAKEQLLHGEWGKWLEDKVEFSQWTANKFMKCANEYSNCGTFHNLEQSKIFKLLDIPLSEREEFMAAPHEVNGETKTVDEMSARELQQAIKEKKEAEKRAIELEQQLANEIAKPKEVVTETIDKTDYDLVDNLEIEKKSLQLKVIELQDKISQQKGIEYENE